MSKHSIVATVADDAINQLQTSREYMGWIDSLSWVIQSTLKAGHTHHAERLASIAQYLSGDYHNMLDCEVKSLNERLETLELRG